MEKTVALIGCGALGSTIAQGIADTLGGRYSLVGVLGLTPEEPLPLVRRTGGRAYHDLEALLADRPDYVIEAAGAEAVRQYACRVLEGGSDLVMLSVGALADEDLREQLERTARTLGRKIHLPSGAIGGLDVLRAMRLMGGSMTVRVENRKAPQSLEGAPGLAGRQLSDREELIFSGTAREAIRSFPKNVNVAVAAALSGLGTGQTRVDIVSVPGLEENVHCIHGENGSVRVRLETASYPDPANPRSSTLAAWSVVALLENLASPFQF